MDLGIGLPSTIASATGADILAWAREADAAGFSPLGTIDRVVYGNHETIPTLAAAAAVTSRIRLTTAILIAPFRGNGTLLAKQLATVDSFAGGRLTVGIAVGGRDDDYTATRHGLPPPGAIFDAQLAEMRAVWSGAPRHRGGGPAPCRPATAAPAHRRRRRAPNRRLVEYGAGWISGGGGRDGSARAPSRIRAAWTTAAASGAPRLVALGYYALGPDATALAEGYLGDYYGFAGPYAAQVAAGARPTPGTRSASRGGVRRGRLRRADPLPVQPRRRPAAAPGQGV